MLCRDAVVTPGQAARLRFDEEETAVTLRRDRGGVMISERRSCMLLFPIGLIFVFFYINIPVFGRTVDILPDVAGYLLIAANAWQFREKSDSFSNLVYLSGILAVYSTAVRLIEPRGMAGIALSLLELILQLYLLKWIEDGVKDLEQMVGAHLNTDVLYRWRILVSSAWAAVFVLTVSSALAPELTGIALAAAAAWAVLCVLLLVTLFRTGHRYKLLVRFGPPEPDRVEEESDDGEADEDVF